MTQDPTLLSQIWFEDLLYRTQSTLAASAGLPLRNGKYFFAWKYALDEVGEDTVARRDHARAILAMTQIPAGLTASDEAMDILCMKKVNVRLGGNHVMPPTADNKVNNLAILRTAAESLLDPGVKKGVLDIINFDFSTHL